MSRLDLIFLAVYGLIIGSVVNFVLRGPETGLTGLAIGLLIMILAWFIGRALVIRGTGPTVQRDRAYRIRMWNWSGVAAALLFAVCLAWVLGVTNGRTSYPWYWLAAHFAVLLLAATLGQVMTFSAKQAVASHDEAKKAAVTASATRKKPRR